MALSPELIDMLAFMNSMEMPSLESITPEEYRILFAFPPAEEVHPIGAVENRTTPGPAGDIPVRIYTPDASGPFPVLAFYHGGGFVLCDLDSHDDLCRKLCTAMKAVVVSVDYRLAPEATFPAAPDDCYAATQWCADNMAALKGSGKLMVGGDSAGGCLAAAVCMMSKAQSGPEIDHQFLIYPVTDCDFTTGSYQDFSEGYFLSQEMMRWFWGHYLDNESDANNPLASPLRAADLSGMPPATVITAGFDPLRDEGKAFADKLVAAGVAVKYHCYDDMIHGFLGLPVPLTAATAAIDFLAEQV
ncbi:MAG: acetyl esterase [Bermanella sp.]|jgi:acetyl esterase